MDNNDSCIPAKYCDDSPPLESARVIASWPIPSHPDEQFKIKGDPDVSAESIIEQMRKDGWLLDLSSTFDFADTKYSAAFFGDGPKCDECDQQLRSPYWEDYSHANTIEEVVTLAFNKHFGIEQ